MYFLLSLPYLNQFDKAIFMNLRINTMKISNIVNVIWDNNVMFATTQRLFKKPQKAKKRKTPQRTTIGNICKISPMLLALNASRQIC